MKPNYQYLLLVVLLLFATGGAACPRRMPWGVAPQQPAFAEPPTLEALMAHINANSARVRQLQATGASLSVPGTMGPSLRADLSLELPRRLRLVGGTGLGGSEVDLGSNDELFWVWVKRGEPPAVYYARHEQIRQSGLDARLPLDPQWLVDALGLMTFDPAERHEGPKVRQDGKLEIRSTRTTSSRQLTRIIIVDPQYGWVLAQHIYDERGVLTASAMASEHRYEPLSGVTLPHKIELQMPADQLTIRLEVGSWQVNQLYGDPTQLWTLPKLQGYEYIDLGAPGALGPVAPLEGTAMQASPFPVIPLPATPARLPEATPLNRQNPLPTAGPLQGYRGFADRR